MPCGEVDPFAETVGVYGLELDFERGDEAGGRDAVTTGRTQDAQGKASRRTSRYAVVTLKPNALAAVVRLTVTGKSNSSGNVIVLMSFDGAVSSTSACGRVRSGRELHSTAA